MSGRDPHRGTVLLAHPSAELYGSDRMFLESVVAALATGRRVVVTLVENGPLVARLRRRGAAVVFCPTPVLRKSALRPAGFVKLVATAVRGLVPTVRLLLRERPAVVYVNTLTLPLWLVLPRLAGHRIIAHVHESEDTVAAPIRFALALPLLAARTVLANSLATANLLRRTIPRLRHRTTVVYNGVTGPDDHGGIGDPPDHDEATPWQATAPNPLRLLLIGRISPRKGTDIAVAALAVIAERREVTLRIVGSAFHGYEWYEQRLRELVSHHGLDGRVSISGFTDDIWSCYAAADVAVVPSRVEPFGNASVEAQLAGVPVVVTDVGGLPETVAGGRFGAVVPPRDPDALAAAITGLADDWRATLVRATSARTEAMARFAPAAYRETIAGLIRTAVGGT